DDDCVLARQRGRGSRGSARPDPGLKLGDRRADELHLTEGLEHLELQLALVDRGRDDARALGYPRPKLWIADATQRQDWRRIVASMKAVDQLDGRGRITVDVDDHEIGAADDPGDAGSKRELTSLAGHQRAQ